MPAPKGTRYTIKTKPDGTRIRYGVYNGRIIEKKSLSSRRKTKTEKHLSKTRRRTRR